MESLILILSFVGMVVTPAVVIARAGEPKRK